MKIFKLKLESLIPILLLGLLFTSCREDFLDEEDPDSIVIDNYFQTREDFSSAVNGMYAAWRSSGLYGDTGGSSALVIFGDIVTDNLVLSTGRQSNRTSYNWEYDAGSAGTSIYQGAYIMISRANLILDNIDNLPDDTDGFKDNIRAQALGLRGIAHFEVARHYSKIPTQSADANSSLGIAYVETYDPQAEPSRLPTVSESYQKIMADLMASRDALPLTSDNGYLNYYAMQGMISRVALHMGDYPMVLSAAQEVVDNVSPAAAADLSALWTVQSQTGVLINVPIILTDDADLGTEFSQGTGSSINIEYSVDKAFYELYDQATEPERIAAYFATAATVPPQYVVSKYMQGVQGTNIGDGRYLRVEEVILNMAEAQYMQGDEAGALASLDMLRDVRYSSYTGGETGDDLIEAIIEERRKELCFEAGDRFSTLKRLQGVPGLPSSLTSGVVRSGNGYNADGTGVPPQYLLLGAGDHRWQLPIPQSYLEKNPNIQQNPNY